MVLINLFAVLEKTLESPLDCKEIQPVHPKGDQSWVFTGRTDAEAKTPILWPPDEKSWLIWKDPDAGKDWGQEEKGTTEDEMAGWTWVWVDSESWWWTGRPGMLRFMESQRVRHDWTELNWTMLVIAFLPRNKHLLISQLQSTSAVILKPHKIKSATVSIVSPSICHEVMGPHAMSLVFWMLNFKPTFSLSSFPFTKKLFSSFSLSAIRVVSSAYLRLLIFVLTILILACASSSPAFHMMYSVYKLNKQGDDIQPWRTPYSNKEL